MSKRDVFLELAPEFGGTRFGPFSGAEIRLGSEPGRNDIVLPEALGVAPEHARLVKQQDESFILTPVDRTAQIHLYRADGRPPKPVASPVAIGANDGFSLVSAEGPRFILLLEFPKGGNANREGAQKKKGKEKLTAATFMEEVKRQGLTRALTTSVGQNAQKAWTFIKSGSFLQPRYIITGMMLISGWIFAGTVGCGTLGLAWKWNEQGKDLEECQRDNQTAKAMASADSAEPGMGILTILKDTYPEGAREDLDRTLRSDQELKSKVVSKIASIFANKRKYEWTYTLKKDNAFMEYHKALSVQGLPAALARPLSYAAAAEVAVPDFKWRATRLPDGSTVCVRGPMQMSYRQAKNLGIGPLLAEGFVSMESLDDTNAKRAAVAKTLGIGIPGATPLPAAEEGAEATPAPPGGIPDTLYPKTLPEDAGGQCFSEADGDADLNDARVKPDELAKAIAKLVDPRDSKLPRDSQTNWVPVRLMKLLAAESPAFAYAKLNFNDDRAVSAMIKDSPLIDSEKGMLLNNIAAAYAQSIAIPCLMKRAVDKPDSGLKLPKHLEADYPPAGVGCWVLQAMAADQAL